MVKGKATICIINYKTLDLTRLCLRSVRKFTKYPYEVIVVDNNSQDESSEYLKHLSWIRLIERRKIGDLPPLLSSDRKTRGPIDDCKPVLSEVEGSKISAGCLTAEDRKSEIGGYAHAAGLDLGLASCNTEFFVSLHSDTFVQKENWLSDLIRYFGDDGNVACVGSGKIELTPKWRMLLKKATDIRTFKRKLIREPDPMGKFRYYNRTICCLYRTDILRRENLSFLMDRDKGLTGGKKLYFELVDRGYKTVELPSSIMGQYIIHLAHATQAVNPQEFTLRKKTVRKYNRIIDKVMSRALVQNILTDESLDR
ncbi:MAG: glycosyltransferase family 2 protein [Phycisphaerae bacterium]